MKANLLSQRIKTVVLLMVAFFGFVLSNHAQTIVTIGTGTTQNSAYPCPYGNWYKGVKEQMLILASELTAAGASAGTISALGFSVSSPAGAPLTGFTISLGNTTVSSLSSFITSGLTQVYTITAYTTHLGWNMHTFSTNFIWDGTSNLLVETCFENPTYTSNAVMNKTTTTFVSTLDVHGDAGGICTSGYSSPYSQRPNIQIQSEDGALHALIPFMTGFETGAIPPEVVASSGPQSAVYVSSNNSYTGTYSTFMEGNTSTGWGATPTTQAQAFDPSKSTHFGNMDIEIHPDIGNPGVLTIGFWMRQNYSFNMNYSWLQCLVNGVNVADVDGIFYYQPASASGDSWVYKEFDLSLYQNDASFIFTFNSSCKYYYPYYLGGDVAMIDDINIWYVNGNSNNAPVAECQNVTVVANEYCEGLATPEQVDNESYDPDGDPITFSLDPPGPYQLGETTVTLTVEDDSGETDQCTATVTVVDVTSPNMIPQVQPHVIWPPNHQYETFVLGDFVSSVSDNCASLTIDDVSIYKATSDELENGQGGGDGNTMNDIIISGDCKSVQLRKERNANGNGRVYTIYLELDDGNGNTSSATCQVQVPHNNGGTAIDDGAVYEVLGNCGNKSSFIAGNNNLESEIELINYPNPFTNSTTLVFSVAEVAKTTLKVYNSMGKEVAVLFNGYAEADQNYDNIFKGSGLPKGLYICHLQSGDKHCTKRMLLVR